MKLNINKRDLIEIKDAKVDKKIRKREVKLNMRNVSTSIDLRGLDAMEATYQVDQYLDEATLGGLENVTIIHGVGTGVLKEKLWDMFRHHPHVKGYRLGEYGEGGQGVTIVTIK